MINVRPIGEFLFSSFYLTKCHKTMFIFLGKTEVHDFQCVKRFGV